MNASAQEPTSLPDTKKAHTDPICRLQGVRIAAGRQAGQVSAAVQMPGQLEIAPGGPGKTYLIDRVWRGYNALNGVRMVLALGLLIAWITT